MCGILFLSNSSCQKDSINGVQSAEFNQPFDLELNSRVILPRDNSDLMIEFVQLNDSRCPADGQCIWAGNATVNLKFAVQANAETTASLCLGQCEKQFKESDTARVNLNNISYTVILQEVKPYPGKDRTSKKKAVLIVQKD